MTSCAVRSCEAGPMETPQLIQLVMQQTTVLIAELATSAGLRAPLARLADQVFLDLTQEISRQGVSRSVIADMFGISLRSFQKKVHRLRAGATQPEQTLWEGVLRHVEAHGGATRSQVLAAFSRDDPRDVVAVLRDLVASGVLYGTGRGQLAAYRAASAADQEALFRERSLDTLLHLVWLEIGAGPEGVSHAELLRRFPNRAPELDQALDQLVQRGDVHTSEDDGMTHYRTEAVHIPVGSEAGWESAVFDHFRAVCGAIANKLRNGGPGADAGQTDLIGGATLAFEVYPGHPYEHEVKQLLPRLRAQANEVWSRVNAYNRQAPTPNAETRQRVVFYLGQNVLAEPEERDEAHDIAE